MEMLVIALIVLLAFAVVLLPLFRRRPGVGDEREFENIPPATAAKPAVRPPADAVRPPAGAEEGSGDALEDSVQRYREAVRAGTVCRKCGQANPAGSVYCYECGERLPLGDAKEFE